MSAFRVAAMQPEPTGEQILQNLRRLLQPTIVKVSPAVKSRTAVLVEDDGERIIVCSWDDRAAIEAALAQDSSGRFVFRGTVA